jgi:6-pyruvoyltetrahydropterin/6-carboxytetrahydropterin synthase
MRVRIAKDFVWEMSHRLPFHKGGCKNIHGHSYKLRVEAEGETDGNGMIMDYYDMAAIIEPLIARFDHAFLVDESDKIMLDFLKQNDFKHYVVNCTTTAENIAKYILDEIKISFIKFSNIDTLKVRFHETYDVFAELEIKLR